MYKYSYNWDTLLEYKSCKLCISVQYEFWGNGIRESRN